MQEQQQPCWLGQARGFGRCRRVLGGYAFQGRLKHPAADKDIGLGVRAKIDFH